MTLSQSDVTELLDAIRAGGDLDVIRKGVELVLQALIEAEATEVIGAERYERSDGRRTWRNGSRQRLLTTKAGDVELAIPKLRKGSLGTFSSRSPAGVDNSSGRCPLRWAVRASVRSWGRAPMATAASASMSCWRIHSSEVRMVSLISPALRAARRSDRSEPVRATGVLLLVIPAGTRRDSRRWPTRWWTLRPTCTTSREVPPRAQLQGLIVLDRASRRAYPPHIDASRQAAPSAPGARAASMRRAPSDICTKRSRV